MKKTFITIATVLVVMIACGARPALSTHIDPEVMANYDVIYLGFPIWWYDLPTPVWTFLEEYDLSGKTIVPFFSHNGSSGGANSLNRLKATPHNSRLTP